MKRYPKYKDSGVEWIGEVPEHWEVKRLRHVSTLNPSPDWRELEQQQSNYPFLPMEAIGEAGSLDTSGHKALSECRSGYTYFAEGDVAYAKVTPCFENGKGAVIRGLDGGHGFGTTELTVLRPTVIDPDYLYALTFAESFRQPGASEMLGSGGLKRVPDEFTRNYRAAIPPPAEQSAIAAALDRETARIDALIEKKTRFIELLKEKRQALITHAVTKGLDPNVKMKDSGVEWIGEVPEHWVLMKFGRVARVTEGLVDPRAEPYRTMPLFAPNHIESGTGRLLGVESADEQNAESGKYLCNVGCVVYSKIRPALSKVIIAPTNGLCSADMYPLTCTDKAQAQWLFYLMLSQLFTAWATLESDRVAMPKINRESLAELVVAVPPTPEQQEIASAISNKLPRVDAVIGKVNASITLLKERRSALITAAVTGQIDLREAATANAAAPT